jgi:hypothetical protein
MGLRFRYWQFRTRQPVISLKGRKGRPQPVIPVALIGPKGQAARDAVVDPAADDTVFSLSRRGIPKVHPDRFR